MNETCKDAMNLSEFIDNIKLQLSDLESIGKLGYVEGISNIIIKSLNALDVKKRPLHCSDIKREIMYVKDEDEWQKEQDDKTRIKSVISSIVSKNLGLLPEFEKKYPDYLKPDSKNRMNTIKLSWKPWVVCQEMERKTKKNNSKHCEKGGY